MKIVKLKINRSFFRKIMEDWKWFEIRNENKNIDIGDIIEFIDSEKEFKVGEIKVIGFSILDKKMFLESKETFDEWGKHKNGYGLDNGDKEWLECYLNDTDKVYIYHLSREQSERKFYSYNRFVYLLSSVNGFCLESRAVFKDLKKARRGLKLWKKAYSDYDFVIQRMELEDRNLEKTTTITLVSSSSKEHYDKI